MAGGRAMQRTAHQPHTVHTGGETRTVWITRTGLVGTCTERIMLGSGQSCAAAEALHFLAAQVRPGVSADDIKSQAGAVFYGYSHHSIPFVRVAILATSIRVNDGSWCFGHG